MRLKYLRKNPHKPLALFTFINFKVEFSHAKKNYSTR